MGRRRLRTEGSIYQRASDNRWVGVVDLGIVNGKRVRKTVTAATKRELTPKFNALKESTGSGVDDEQLTVKAWMERWLTEVASERNRESTLRTYRMYVDNWIVPQVGHVRLAKLRPDHVQGLMHAMTVAGKSDSTRRQVYAILRRSLKVAVNFRLIPRNPADAVDAPSVGKGSHGKFTLTEAKALLAACQRPDGSIESRWVCALLAGLRQGEALGLMWDDVDLDNRRIVVRQAAQQVKGEGVKLVPLKSAASYRAVPMVAPVWAALSRQERSGAFVWGGDQPRAPRRDWQAWGDFVRSVEDVPYRPLHAARATCGSLLLDAGVPDKIIAEILGHSQVQVTREHYLHGDDTMHRSAMDRLDGLLELGW